MTIDNFHHHLAHGDIVVYADQYTIGFLKHMTRDHYPGITLRGRELTDEEGAGMLEKVNEKKQYLRKRKVPEEGEEYCEASGPWQLRAARWTWRFSTSAEASRCEVDVEVQYLRGSFVKYKCKL